ncbi:NUDIX domain-containing protein [Streptomyces scopuliridis]|uniref:NUDIX hydrolase n=1 Tax=Streptomyces scopuliridis TaxID=452529 RepID=UPI002DDB5487|nr:NUDIX domain-containing protein [Streptomyces scopuliridis]WSB38886.1 NUDIX domain-containing protein [Streptomyces scopuliridis]
MRRVRHAKDYRDVPGGYIERGESPLQACVCEVHEEPGTSTGAALDRAPMMRRRDLRRR